MNYYCIADTHFGHNKMVEWGSRKKGFEEEILDEIYDTVNDGDVLIHLGDVSFYNHDSWQSDLIASSNCTTWLVRGNHDRMTMRWYLKKGWNFVADSFSLKIFGKRLVFSHVPFIENSLITDGNYDFNIHGHYHDDNHRPEINHHQNILVTHKLVNLRTIIGM